MTIITCASAKAFESGKPFKKDNTLVVDNKMYLFGNLIAERREDGLYITSAGWLTKTTKERLNGLSRVQISQKKGVWYLNGKEWDGSWIKVYTANN